MENTKRLQRLEELAENIKSLKNVVVRAQCYEAAAHIRSAEQIVLGEIDKIKGTSNEEDQSQETNS